MLVLAAPVLVQAAGSCILPGSIFGYPAYALPDGLGCKAGTQIHTFSVLLVVIYYSGMAARYSPLDLAARAFGVM